MNLTENTQNKIPRVCAAHDLSGFGRVSLTEVIPCLAAMGVEVCPLPTAVLSTHTYKFTDYSFFDLTAEMRNMTKHWEKLGVCFDAVYTGYLGSGAQFEILSDFIDRCRKNGSKIIVDPVLGDNILSDCSSVYSDRMNDVLVGMKNLIKKADIITPNFTEVSLLLDKPYESGYIPDEKIAGYMRELSAKGPSYIAATSVMTGENEMSVVAYEKDTDKVYKIDCGYVGKPFHGTGDIFASILTGAFVRGIDFLTACRTAADFVRRAIEETLKHSELKTVNGVCFEQILVKYFSGETALPEFTEIKI